MPDFQFLRQEARATLDDRYRVTIPAPLIAARLPRPQKCVLVKERPFCVSVWDAETWQEETETAISLVEQKMASHRLREKREEVARLGRLLAAQHQNTRLDPRGRLRIMEGFRDFLGIEPGGEAVIIAGAASVELWRPDAWNTYLHEHMPSFRRLLEELAG